MNESATKNPLKIIASLILISPILILRFGKEAFRFKSMAHRAGRIFRRELVQQGLDKSIAAQLTGFYLEGSDPFKLLRSLR